MDQPGADGAGVERGQLESVRWLIRSLGERLEDRLGRLIEVGSSQRVDTLGCGRGEQLHFKTWDTR
jgi:hypothetical protein